jgi:hypothetical protein
MLGLEAFGHFDVDDFCRLFVQVNGEFVLVTCYNDAMPLVVAKSVAEKEREFFSYIYCVSKFKKLQRNSYPNKLKK